MYSTCRGIEKAGQKLKSSCTKRYIVTKRPLKGPTYIYMLQPTFNSRLLLVGAVRETVLKEIMNIQGKKYFFKIKT